MTREDIRNMNAIEYPHAVKYAWSTFNQRRIDYNLSEFFKAQSNKQGSGNNTLNINWSELNPVSKELEKRNRIIPERFLNEMNEE
ncbi:MAG: hypothetical protein OEL89_00025 [Candidatus Peregrinibacteria bacterium]|nr:hypothetical protein [Candidatus Peregrinibacteria bacterium]